MKFLIIIPARKGSKGVPGKNKIKILDKPLIQYTIEQALNLDDNIDIIISSDDSEIFEITDKFNLKKRIRPDFLSQDKSKMLPVLNDALIYYNKFFNKPDYVILLQPTCPLRRKQDIINAINKVKLTNCDTLISVIKVEDSHPGRMYRKTTKGLVPNIPNLVEINRQDLPPLYLRNGAIYIVKSELILNNVLYGNYIESYEMNRNNSINIDDAFDLKLAEILIKNEIIKS
jgi:CMP-N,N'-diacetyllegionaminic acid synthase